MYYFDKFRATTKQDYSVLDNKQNIYNFRNDKNYYASFEKNKFSLIFYSYNDLILFHYL